MVLINQGIRPVVGNLLPGIRLTKLHSAAGSGMENPLLADLTGKRSN